MSQFGADIFDDEPPRPPSRKTGRRGDATGDEPRAKDAGPGGDEPRGAEPAESAGRSGADEGGPSRGGRRRGRGRSRGASEEGAAAADPAREAGDARRGSGRGGRRERGSKFPAFADTGAPEDEDETGVEVPEEEGPEDESDESYEALREEPPEPPATAPSEEPAGDIDEERDEGYELPGPGEPFRGAAGREAESRGEPEARRPRPDWTHPREGRREGRRGGRGHRGERGPHRPRGDRGDRGDRGERRERGEWGDRGERGHPHGRERREERGSWRGEERPDRGRPGPRERGEPRGMPPHAARARGEGDEPPPAVRSGQRIGVLVDLDALQAEAQESGGELSFRKLLRSIAADRPVVRAICYSERSTPEGAGRPLIASGFELRSDLQPATAAVALAVDAMALASRVDAVVLAPMSAPLAPLLEALRSQGLGIEVASFEGAAPAGTQARRLGRECLFVP